MSVEVLEDKTRYLIFGQHSWSRNAFNELMTRVYNRYKWFYVNNPDKLLEAVKKIEPTKIFFMHWSFIVPKEVTNNYECICFHPSHLPYGRGGTPIQNLIKQGFKKTKLTAFRMTEEIDAGPIYLKQELSLTGSAQDIYTRIATLSTQMIEDIIRYDIKPYPQQGEPVYFKRRTPPESEIVGDENLEDLYDHIRMLSAESYPHAFIEYNDYIIKFSDPFPPNGNSMLVHAVIYRKEEYD